MRKSLQVFTALGATSLAACVPMEQAALTYSSKSTIGVGVEAGTQQAPGLEVTIGFKESNIALVPVAVAKYCYKASGTQCQDAIYQMQLIKGGRRDLVENLPLELQINDINTRLAQLNNEQNLSIGRLADLRAGIAVAEAAFAAQSELDKLGPADDNAVPEAVSERAELLATAQSASDDFDLDAARRDAAKIETEQTARGKKIDVFQEQRARLTAQLESNSEKGRNDAYSVYGRFSGSANGTSTGAGLTAGKVFATGIAAQNITEFGTQADCFASIRSLALMIDDTHAADRNKLLTSAAEICKRGS